MNLGLTNIHLMCYILFDKDDTPERRGIMLKRINMKAIDRELENRKIEVARRMSRVSIV